MVKWTTIISTNGIEYEAVVKHFYILLYRQPELMFYEMWVSDDRKGIQELKLLANYKNERDLLRDAEDIFKSMLKHDIKNNQEILDYLGGEI